MFGKDKRKEEENQKNVQRFYNLLQLLLNELLEYASKVGHVKIPNVSFGLVYDKRDSLLLTGIDQKSGKKMYLYNARIISDSFEQRRSRMISDKTTEALFEWINEVCSIYISPFVYEYVINIQHRGKGSAHRTTRHIVRGFLDKLINDPNLKYVLDTIRTDDKSSTNKSNGDPRYQK